MFHFWLTFPFKKFSSSPFFLSTSSLQPADVTTMPTFATPAQGNATVPLKGSKGTNASCEYDCIFHHQQSSQWPVSQRVIDMRPSTRFSHYHSLISIIAHCIHTFNPLVSSHLSVFLIPGH